MICCSLQECEGPLSEVIQRRHVSNPASAVHCQQGCLRRSLGGVIDGGQSACLFLSLQHRQGLHCWLSLILLPLSNIAAQARPPLLAITHTFAAFKYCCNIPTFLRSSLSGHFDRHRYGVLQFVSFLKSSNPDVLRRLAAPHIKHSDIAKQRTNVEIDPKGR